MPLFLDRDHRLLVQGITGTQARFHTASMLEYGTHIAAGVTPGKGGQKVEGLPVYDKVDEAVARHDVNCSIVFVPAPGARAAVVEALEAGVKTVIVITEGIPQLDSIELVHRARFKGASIIGPNCPGMINPELKILAGILPRHIFAPGGVGIVSRSGTLTYEVAWQITRAGAGQSTCVGIGGDPVIGLDFITILEMFKMDKQTTCVVLIGEIGGTAENMAAEYLRRSSYPKPVVAYIAGRTAPEGKHMGHAGAIISGGSSTAASKIEAFTRSGIPVAVKPGDIVQHLNQLGMIQRYLP